MSTHPRFEAGTMEAVVARCSHMLARTARSGSALTRWTAAYAAHECTLERINEAFKEPSLLVLNHVPHAGSIVDRGTRVRADVTAIPLPSVWMRQSRYILNSHPTRRTQTLEYGLTLLSTSIDVAHGNCLNSVVTHHGTCKSGKSVNPLCNSVTPAMLLCLPRRLGPEISRLA